MKERGIIFNGEMVRATIDGRKTQTRRVVMHQPDEDGLARLSGGPWMDTSEKVYRCPYGEVGDRLWVRETWSLLGNEDACPIDWNDNLVKGGGGDAARIYRASCEQKPGDYGLWSIPDDADWKPHTEDMKFEGAWTPSIHMPRWASRITLEITDVRVERLNSISEEDAISEGIEPYPPHPDFPQRYHEYFPLGNKNGLRCNMSAASSFAGLWQSIYGEESWNENPWVWAVSFKRIEGA